jgi:hypothetical protein
LPRGRWFSVEQEIVLNSPKVHDGVVRVWIDGEFRAELKDLELREAGDLFVQGADGSVHFGRPAQGPNFPAGRARKSEKVWISPLELRWK